MRIEPAVPADAGDPQDLAGSHFEVDALERRGAAVAPRLESAHGKDHFISRRRGALHDFVQLAADHRARDLRRVRVLRDELPGVPPGAEDGDAVGDGHDLTQLVGNEDERLALVAEGPHDAEELVHLERCQHGRGLVEDEQLRPSVEHLQDLHALLEAERDVLDARGDVDLDVKPRLELVDAALDRGVVQERTSALVAEHHVLGDAQRRHEHEVLVDHPDAERDRVPWPADPHLAPADADGARVGAVQAVEDVHERGLAGAVLAHEGVDLAFADGEVNAAEGVEITEALLDAPHLEERCLLRGDGRRERSALTLGSWLEGHAWPSAS